MPFKMLFCYSEKGLVLGETIMTIEHRLRT